MEVSEIILQYFDLASTFHLIPLNLMGQIRRIMQNLKEKMSLNGDLNWRSNFFHFHTAFHPIQLFDDSL